MNNNTILFLNEKTIKNLISYKEAIKSIEKSFNDLGLNKVQMPPKLYINLDKFNGDFRAMPGYCEKINSCGIKWVNVHPDNRKKGLPTVMALIILSDPKTGLPLCLMNGTYLTSIRTGAAGAVAAKYLARKDSKNIAFIGCGNQAITQFESLNSIFNIKEISVWGQSKNELNSFKKGITETKNMIVNLNTDIEKTVSNADIIVTTTPSRTPLLKSKWIKKGTHINAIGADAKGKQELEPKILKSGKIIVDAWEQASHSGEINISVTKKYLSKKDIYSNIGEIVCGKKKGRTNNNEITIFDSTGLSIQDISIANLIYKKAKKTKKGTYIKL